jgi:hypothetical protein
MACAILDMGACVLWMQADGMMALGILTGGTGSATNAVNASGWVVGGADSGGVAHPFLWTQANGMMGLDNPPSGTNCTAKLVNAIEQDRLFRSDDGGASWQRVGRTLPEPNTTVRGIAASEEAIVVTTDRGLYRTVDGGESWTMIVENLPAHLEAGPLVRDPGNSAILYAGFALVPYPELWRRAAEREGALARVSITSLAGGGIFLVVVALGALAALRWLGQYYRPSVRGAPATRPPRDHRMEKTLP